MAVVPVEIKQSTTSTATVTRVSGRTADGQIVVVHTATDDGAGAFLDTLGSINYSTRQLFLKVVDKTRTTESYKSDYDNAQAFEAQSINADANDTSSTNAARKGGDYATSAVGEEVLAGTAVVARYRVPPAAPQSKSMDFVPPAVAIDLCPLTIDSVVAGSVQFVWMGATYIDREGKLYRNVTPANPAGIESGTIDYESGQCLLTDYDVGANPGTVTLQSLWTRRKPWNTASLFMRVEAAPVKPTGFVLNVTDTKGSAISATADLDGNLSGPHIRGKIDYESGVVELQFGDFVLDSSLTAEQKDEWWYSADDVGAVPGQAGKIWRPWPVDPTTLRYNAVSYFYLPIDASILGLDPVRLPQDGRVPMFRVGSYVVVGHTGRIGPVTVSNGQTVNCARTRLSRVRVVGANGTVINTGYTADLDAGTVTFTDVSGYSQPVTVEHRIEDMVRVRDVQINGTLGLSRALSHDYPVPGSYVSGALIAGNLKARVSALWDQATWDGVTWSDTITGSAATATYNDTAAPIVVTNAGAITQRWALRFKDTQNFDVIGEFVGNLGTYSINAVCAPVNPISGAPYFTIQPAGWGLGWAAGNTVRMNTVGAMFSYAAIRTVQPSAAAGTDFRFELLTRGDVDRPPSAP